MLDFEKIDIGMAIPSLNKRPTNHQLSMYAEASGDYNPIHLDRDFAVGHSLPGVVVHGQLSTCFLGQMLTDWLKDSGSLVRLSVSYKGMNFPGDVLTCSGKITDKLIDQERRLLEISVWIERQTGDRTLSGSATVELF
jgi:acyl dehydratase